MNVGLNSISPLQQAVGSRECVQVRDSNKTLIYQGQVNRKGEPHGRGSSFKNGKIQFSGEWKDNRPWKGTGDFFHSNGALEYKGDVNYGQYHGWGTSYNKNGDIEHRGYWDKNNFVGRSIENPDGYLASSESSE